MNKIFFFLLIGLISILSCKENVVESSKKPYLSIQGKTMGTTYNITYENIINKNLKGEIDSFLVDFNKSLSTYDPTSTISKFNSSTGNFCYAMTEDKYLLESLSKALQISEETDGAFDPTVMPLVNYWGFGYKEKKMVEKPNQNTIDSLLNLVGYKKVGVLNINDSICISRDVPNMSIDLSASAPGHAVDLVAVILASYGIENYMVEIGGELITKGVNDRNMYWTIGISKPEKGASTQEILLPVMLKNKALATSGNYRNYYENGKVTYAHIIDPKTGDSRPTDILSSTIIADDCLTADAYATACMVKGLEKAKLLVNNKPDIDACFIYLDGDKNFKYFYTKGFLKYADSLLLQ
jgi:FAD:protein FMN transferase